MLVDTHVHLLGHRDRPATEANIRLFLDAAVRRDLSLIGFADHEEYLEDMRPDLLRTVALDYPQLRVLVGVELDYRPGEEGRLRAALRRHKFDFAIGSVHELTGRAIDRTAAEADALGLSADELYRRYFACVAQAAASGLFDIVGHIDLVKIFGARPQTATAADLAAGALDAVAAAGCAIELNTNGRYKPVGEWYPSPSLLAAAAARNIPVTTGSDAHYPEQVGREIAEAAAVLSAIGARRPEKFGRRARA
ncbi:MAG: histidinol-phosphatase HisJ family protein [Gracilibacteraceae bacterium]|jgi:histidinol-phosphatase (PHP family)|nr:histidinol-phosphatase HisJ family protein [Gracilibacteraceae bacterium]